MSSDIEAAFQQADVPYEDSEEPIDERNEEVLQLWIEGQDSNQQSRIPSGGDERVRGYEPQEAQRDILDVSEELEQVLLEAVETEASATGTEKLTWSNRHSSDESARSAIEAFEEREGVEVYKAQPVEARRSSRNAVKVWWERDVSHQEQHILAGKDTQHLFMCTLPEKPGSVEDAHSMLKPWRAYRPGTKRQGEWFFVPVHAFKRYTINRRIEKAKAPWFSDRAIPWSAELRSRGQLSVSFRDRSGTTPHYAEELTVGALRWPRNGTVHVRGTITHERHEPLHLEEWHTVVQNNETTHQQDAKTENDIGNTVRWVD